MNCGISLFGAAQSVRDDNRKPGRCGCGRTRSGRSCHVAVGGRGEPVGHYDAARSPLFAATQVGTPAPRYGIRCSSSGTQCVTSPQYWTIAFASARQEHCASRSNVLRLDASLICEHPCRDFRESLNRLKLSTSRRFRNASATNPLLSGINALHIPAFIDPPRALLIHPLRQSTTIQRQGDEGSMAKARFRCTR